MQAYQFCNSQINFRIMKLVDLLQQLRLLNQAFVSFRLPSNNVPFTLYGGKVVNELPQAPQDYFIMAPFDRDAGQRKKILIDSSRVEGFEIEVDLSLHTNKKSGSKSATTHPVVITREMYNRQANLLINKMKARQLSKVVLSRVVHSPVMNALEAAKTYVLLCETYPSAFVYYFSDGDECHWMGASPEILLFAEADRGSTMALAGTQALDNTPLEEIVWADKEKEEQEMVALYIRRALTLVGVQSIHETAPKTVAAGRMAHLLTSFDFSFTESTQRESLLQLLHPTPAVCGLPREEAMQAIRAVETHSRSFYSGYLGPVSQSGDCKLFVNLRCMQLTETGTFLYVGGGLTARSDVQREWEETMLKASTLGRVIAINS